MNAVLGALVDGALPTSGVLDLANDETDRRTLRRLMHVIHRFRLVRQTMPAHLIEALLRVALDEGRSVKWYAEQSAVSTSVMSRHLLDLGSEFRSGDAGLELVEKRTAAHSLREHEVYLTAKGRHTVKEVANILLHGKATEDL
jgi:DNA-binding MarR family transcriptional regulator